MSILNRLGSDAVLDAAYEWLCRRRKGYPPNAAVWSFRFRWQAEKPLLQQALLSGTYRFSTLERITPASGEEIDLWSARDALVLKALTIVLADVLPVSERCTHVKGHGGAKRAIRQVLGQRTEHRFVLKTDVKSYYASIDHLVLLDQLAKHIKDRRVLNLLGQYLKRTVEFGGTFTS